MLTLKNFRCWENQSFDINENGIILLSGISGKGKSTILNSIFYAITGTLKNISTFGKDKKQVDVILKIDNIIITRGKNPTRFNVKRISDQKIFEQDEAQSIINELFGSEFKHISYIDQDNQHSFVYLSPEAKMTFLRHLLLKDEPIEKMKEKTKSKLDTSKKELIEHDSKISISSSFLSSLTFIENNNYKIQKRIITTENYKDTLDSQQTNLEKCKKNKNVLLTKLKNLEQQLKIYNEQSIFLSKISDYKEQLKDFNELLLSNNLKKYSNEKINYEQNQLHFETKKKYKEDCNLLNEYQLKLKEFNTETFKKIKVIEKIISIQSIISQLDEKIGQDKEEQLLKKKDQLELKIKEIKISIEQQNVYECPGCNLSLKLKDGILLTFEKIECHEIGSIQIQTKLEKDLVNIQKELTLFEKNKEEYNKQFDLFDELAISFETDCDFENLLISLKKEEKQYCIFQSKLNDIEKKVNSYSFNDNIIEIDKEFNYNETIENIATIKQKLKQYQELSKQLSQLELKIDSISDPTLSISETKEKIVEYEEKIETYTKMISELETWKRTDETNKKYIELKESIEKSKCAKDYLMEEVKCCEKLLYYIKDAETKSIFDFIDTLNSHASIYIEDFFPDEDISISLITNKELKSGKDKTGLFFEVNYKNMIGDIDFLSGGQRDRVNLAFTLALSELVDNRVLLLDECISSLDSETSDIVVETLKEKYKGKLVLCVAHQVNTGVFDKVIKI